jgi:competence protein ComFC
VPLRQHDRRDRGFNQTELIAKAVADKIGLQMIPDILLKIKGTKLQAGLSAAERWLNVKDVFAVQPGINLADKAILLVDDIVTTGATCRESSGALYRAGAKGVTVFALACADDKFPRN